jgi:glyceraldehyde 3-phosphate dehydrogenase
VRVPTADVSLTDLTAILKTDATVEQINAAFKQAAQEGQLAPYLDYLEEELVSVDLIGSPASCSLDPYLTKRLGERMVKLFGWYDNEWGYSTRLKDLCLHVLDRI